MENFKILKGPDVFNMVDGILMPNFQGIYCNLPWKDSGELVLARLIWSYEQHIDEHDSFGHSLNNKFRCD